MIDEPGKEWYEHYYQAQKRASVLLAATDDLVEIAHLVLIYLADWRWLQRTGLKISEPPDYGFRKRCVTQWADLIAEDKRTITDKLVCVEGIVWGLAGMAAVQGRPLDEIEKKQLTDAIAFVARVLDDEPDLSILLLCARIFASQDRGVSLKMLGVDLPVQRMVNKFEDYIAQFSGGKYIKTPKEGAGTPEATVVAAETLGYLLCLTNSLASKSHKKISELGRGVVGDAFRRVLESDWTKNEPARYLSYWGTHVNLLGWIKTVMMRWHLADWVIYDATWHDFLSKVDQGGFWPELGHIEQQQEATALRIIAEHCLLMADADPEIVQVNSRVFKYAVLEVIRDEQVAKVLGDRLFALYKGENKNGK